MTFDLKSTREALSRATERPNVATDIYHLAALTYLPAAPDEIERQTKRMAELEARNERLRQWGIDRATDAARWSVIAEKQHAALKKLGKAKRERGKALVEERARRLHRENGSLRCDHYGSPECEEVWQNFCDFAGCPHQKDFVKLAREQLRREGKL